MQLAGPDAHFAWWGEDGNGDAFLTHGHGHRLAGQPGDRRNATTGILAAYARRLCRAGGIACRYCIGRWCWRGRGDDVPCKTLLKGLDEAIAGAELKLKICLRKPQRYR